MDYSKRCSSHQEKREKTSQKINQYKQISKPRFDGVFFLFQKNKKTNNNVETSEQNHTL
jgi:hypothetical protein